MGQIKNIKLHIVTDIKTLCNRSHLIADHGVNLWGLGVQH